MVNISKVQSQGLDLYTDLLNLQMQRRRDLQFYMQIFVVVLYETVFFGHRKRIFYGGKKRNQLCDLIYQASSKQESPPKNEKAGTSGILFLPSEIQSSTKQHAQSPAQALPRPTTHTSAIPVFPHFPSEQRKAFQEHVICGHIITRRGSRGQFSQLKYFYK